MKFDVAEALRNLKTKRSARVARTLAAMTFAATSYERGRVRIIRQHDNRLPPAPILDDPALATLYHDGYANLGNFGIDVEPLAARARTDFDTAPQKDARLRGKCNGNVVIEDHAYIGTGAVLRQGTPDKPLVIGRGAIVGMGAVVTKDVPAGTTVVGNPARPMVKI